MNKQLIFLCVSLAFLIFSIISIITAPAINNKDNGKEMSGWGKLNCQYYSDKEKDADNIDDIQAYQKLKNLCNRKKAMYILEYLSLIIDVVLGFICTQLALLVYFKIGGSIEKISGIFGMIAGIICFILTFIYFCCSGYIFNNDIAYKKLTPGSSQGYNIISSDNMKRYSNGASFKISGSNQIYPYQNEIGDDIQYIKYKDLGKRQYNYDKRYYEAQGTCTTTPYSGCSYAYDTQPDSITNKYLYDNWVTSLIFGCFSFIAAIGLIILGILIGFKKSDSDIQLIPNSETIQITKK